MRKVMKMPDDAGCSQSPASPWRVIALLLRLTGLIAAGLYALRFLIFLVTHFSQVVRMEAALLRAIGEAVEKWSR
jgi:hypothetical protein